MPDGTVSPPQLRRVSLRNIGPFDRLELDLDRSWNVLLGDNGVGKSYVLRAVAVGLIGVEAQPYAARLIKAREISADIILETSRGIYQTRILQLPDDIRIMSDQVRILDAEGWLALGFPPLRTASWRRPAGPQPTGNSRPTGADLPPLVNGELDPRFDSLKQWLVNLHYQILAETDRGASSGRSARLLSDFFEVIRIFTGEIRFHSIDPRTMDVLVETDDGVIPIEAVSQGTASLLGWIGLLLERMFELYGDDANPRERFALILIDEIDAHLHPTWQQSLIDRLRHVFPNVQFIATTHSPLIVSALSKQQLSLLSRDQETRRVVLGTPDVNVSGLNADQVLSGSLFGLRDTRALEMQRSIARYSELLGITRRTATQQEEFAALANVLRKSPPGGETEAQRRVEAAIRETSIDASNAKGEGETVG